MLRTQVGPAYAIRVGPAYTIISTTQVQFAHAERAAEMFQNLAAMLRHVQFSDPIAEHVVDEPRGQLQQELAPQRLQHTLDARSVLDDAIQHQIPDLVVVMGLGKNTFGSDPESRAALALGCVFTVGDLQISYRLERDRAYLASTSPFSFPHLPAVGTRGLLGSAVNRYKDSRGCIRAHACVLSC